MTLSQATVSAWRMAHGAWRMALVCRLIGIPMRVGFWKGKTRLGLTHGVKAMDPEKPIGTELMRALEPLRWDIPRKPFCQLEAKALFISQNTRDLSEKFVCLHAFACSPKRCMPLDEWLDFAEHVKAGGYCFIWIGASFELERLHELGDRRPLPQESSSSYGANSIGQLAWLIAKCDNYVGHDSGPLHVAAALGRRVLGLYLVGRSLETTPQGEKKAVGLS